MGRKKKQNSEKRDLSYKEKLKREARLSIPGDAKRNILAIFLFSLAILFILGFFEKAGTLGNYFEKIGSFLFGWGKWIFPLFLILSGIVLLFRKRFSFYVFKIFGVVLIFFSFLGFFHVYLNTEEMLEIAASGGGGGYVGYAIAIALVKTTGVFAGTVILIAIFLMGVVMAFNFSFAWLASKVSLLKNLFKKEEIMEENEQEKNKSEEPIAKEPEKELEKEPVVDMETIVAENNIKNIKFPEKTKLNPQLKESGKNENPEMDYAHFIEEKKPIKGSETNKSKWIFPPLSLLKYSSKKPEGGNVDEKAEIIKKTLEQFGIKVEDIENKVGPTVTQYSFRPAFGVKLNRITALNSNLALALAAKSIRIEAPIPGKSLVGIEVPNEIVAEIRLREILESELWRKESKSNLTIALGKDVNGDYITADLDKMPHLMIAGATNTGKSVCINSVILSLLYRNSPEDLKFILIDPKRVELSLYDKIPHLITGVIVENGKVVNVLKWAIGEMDKRYQLLQDSGSKDIASYNQKARSGTVIKFTDPETKKQGEKKLGKLPYIVIVIDELADLMLSHGKDVEAAIIRIAQMARAVGIHLIVSTQKPIVTVVTGLIKSNITTRIAFKVASLMDSRTILDYSGAEKLLGNGDMLYLTSNFSSPKRIQGALVSESEVKQVVDFIKNQKVGEDEKEEKEDILNSDGNLQENFNFSPINIDAENFDEDRLYEEAKKIIIEAKKASASLLQRRLRIGYSRAARMLDSLEKKGIIGPADGSKPREILVLENNSSGFNKELEYNNPSEDQEIRDNKWQT